MTLRKRLYHTVRRWLLDHYPAVILKPGRHPKDINEKIRWLMCYGPMDEWARLSDKIKVRDYVAEKGLQDLLVPLLGTWEKSADIPYGSLPEKFVLKCNHDSGSTHIIEPGTDLERVNRELDAALGQKYGYRHGEMHYNRISPRILAEAYLDSGSAVPVDYKIWCFDGKPYCIWACYGRTKDCVYVNVYDLDWKPRPEASVFTEHYRDGGCSLPRPVTLQQMLDAAARLSAGFPEVRVDFMEAKGHLYFGEMTFASLMGRMDFYTDAFLKELGDQVTIPACKNPSRR